MLNKLLNNSRRWAFCLLAFVFLVAVFASCGGRKRDDRYNVVLVVSDALRQDALGCYGGEARTPNLDRLAERGVLFENAYATSPWTPPSAVAIFTGNYSTSYASHDIGKTMRINVPDAETLLAEVLAERGYYNALTIENSQADLHNCLQGFGHLHRQEFHVTDYGKYNIEQITGTRFPGNFGYLNSLAVLNYLLNLPAGENFFVAHWIVDPHEPFQPEGEFAERIVFNPSKLTNPPESYTSWKNMGDNPTEADVRYLKARYLAEVESMDERVGFIQKILDHMGVTGKTYFIFTSDHGEMFGEHDRFGHGLDYFEELVRVPLLIAGPGLPKGRRVQAPVSLVDLTPTIKDLLNVEYEDSMQGKSFKSLISGDHAEQRALYFDDVREHDEIDGLLENGFKLLALQDGECELYDLSKDPHEENDLAAVREDLVKTMLPEVLARRRANEQRRVENLALGGTVDQLSDEEMKELEKKLKTLGYVE